MLEEFKKKEKNNIYVIIRMVHEVLNHYNRNNNSVKIFILQVGIRKLVQEDLI